MKSLFAVMCVVLAGAAGAAEATPAQLAQRKAYRKEAARYEAKEAALRNQIRRDLKTAETLNVTAELMEGLRKFPPVEREHLSEVKSYESGLEREIVRKAGDKKTCVERWVLLSGGHSYRFTADVKAEDVKGCGIKFGLMVPRHGSAPAWPSASVGMGTFDWRTVSFDYEIPSGSDSVLLLYGLEGGTGTVSFRDVTVSEVSRVLE